MSEKERIFNWIITKDNKFSDFIMLYKDILSREYNENNIEKYFNKAYDLVNNIEEYKSLASISFILMKGEVRLDEFIRIALSKELSQMIWDIDGDDSKIDFMGWLIVYYRFKDKLME